MPLTLTQKKESMRGIIQKYYEPTLLQEGFVSTKDGFHWYKLENDLLYKIHLPIESPNPPVRLYPMYGVIPLFTWESIPPTRPYRDWPWEMKMDCAHCLDISTNAAYEIAKQRIGKLPRASYAYPIAIEYLPNDLCVMHLMTDHWGAEALDEVILPMLDTFKTVEDIYTWHKEIRLFNDQCSTEAEFVDKILQRYAQGGNGRISQTFADECLFLRDESLYPIVFRAMSYYGGSCFPNAKKAEMQELALARTHAKVLAEAIQTGNMRLFDAESEQIRHRMLEQIGRKLPNIRGR